MAVNAQTLIRRSENLELPGENATVLDRVRYLITRLRKTQQQFATLIGVDGPNLSRIINGRAPFSDAMINRIVVNIGVSKDWLLHGTDVPFPKTIERNIEIYGDPAEKKMLSRKDGAPVYDIDVTAGYSELSSMFTDDRIIGYLQLPNLNPKNSIVRVSGDSMVPQIPNGSFISIRPIADEAPIFWGHTYLVVLEDYRMVKILRKHEDPDKVILHSVNPAYDDMELPRKDIKSIYVVDTVINYNLLS